MPISVIKTPKKSNANERSKLAKYGIAYVPLPKEIVKKLELIEITGNEYFAQPSDKKEQHSFDPKTREGFLDQRKKGYDIERYIIRKAKNAAPTWQVCINQMLEVKDYFKHEIIEPLLSALFEHLNIDPEKISVYFKEADSTLSVIYYPKCTGDKVQERIQPHQDAALMTILWSQEPGLEVEIDGEWQSNLVKSGHVIVHLGHSLALMTDNRCHAVMHRLRVFEQVSRLSIASFYALNPTELFLNAVTNEKIATTFGEYATEHVGRTYSQKK